MIILRVLPVHPVFPTIMCPITSTEVALLDVVIEAKASLEEVALEIIVRIEARVR